MSELSSLVGDLAEFSAYVRSRVEEKTQLLSSGVVQRSEELQKFLASGFSSATADNGETFIRCIRVKDWAAEKLKAWGCIGDSVADFESYRLTVQILSMLQGISEAQQEFSSGLTYDTIGQVTNQFAGLDVLMVHTALYSRLRKNNCVDFIADPVTGKAVPLFGESGLRLLYADEMPKMGNYYTSYLFSRGAAGIALESNTVVNPATVDADGGSSPEVLFRKWKSCVHPAGFAWKGAVGGGGPTNGELADPAAWKRVVEGSPKMVKVVTREA